MLAVVLLRPLLFYLWHSCHTMILIMGLTPWPVLYRPVLCSHFCKHGGRHVIHRCCRFCTIAYSTAYMLLYAQHWLNYGRE